MHLVRSSLFALLFVGAAGASGCQRVNTSVMEHGGSTPVITDAMAKMIADSVRRVLDRSFADSAFPGAIAVVGRHDRVLAEYGVGHLDWAPGPTPDDRTIWDLASLSKVVGMTSAMMQLVGEGKVDLHAPVQRYLPTWTGPHKSRVTILNLLTHTSGLPADQPPGSKPYDEITHNPDSVAMLLFDTPLDTLPGVRMVYSDVGAYIAGRVVEQVSGQKLDVYLHEHVFEPAGMHETMYNPPASLIPRIAPTEYDPRRGGLLRGKVHDERAYYLGGVSAHAGIFSTAHDLTRFAQMYLNDGVIDGVRVLPAAQIHQFTQYVDSAFSDRAIGWQKPDYPGMKYTSGAAWAGHTMPSRAFGHTGFTGTSIAIDPVDDLFIVLLTNRVDPTRNNNKIQPVRRALTDALMHAVFGPDIPSHSH